MKTWWDYFREDPYEQIGRVVEDSFGAKRVVIMDRMTWCYVDWLRDNEGADVPKFFKDNDIVYRPSEGDYSKAMAGCVKTAFLRREKRGKPRPPWCPPADLIELIDVD